VIIRMIAAEVAAQAQLAGMTKARSVHAAAALSTLGMSEAAEMALLIAEKEHLHQKYLRQKATAAAKQRRQSLGQQQLQAVQVQASTQPEALSAADLQPKPERDSETEAFPAHEKVELAAVVDDHRPVKQQRVELQ
jgi:hypothetical protein